MEWYQAVIIVLAMWTGLVCGFCISRWLRNRLRDFFAGCALEGMLAHSTRYQPIHGLPWHEEIAVEAYEIADAMLKARGE